MSVREGVVCENTQFNQGRPDVPEKVEKYMGIFERRMSEGSMGAESSADKSNQTDYTTQTYAEVGPFGVVCHIYANLKILVFT